MIMFEKTLSTFGYNPLELSSGSNKLVCVKCPDCNLEKETKRQYVKENWKCSRCAKSAIGKKNKKLEYDSSFFTYPTPLNSYWAGFLAADGWIIDTPRNKQVSVQLDSKDKVHLELFASQVGFNGKLYEGMNDRGFSKTNPRPWTRLTVCGAAQWIKDLKENFGIIPAKSLILEPPTNLNHECSIAFVCGLFDGDGYVETNKTMSFLGTSKVVSWIGTMVQYPCSFGAFNSIFRLRFTKEQTKDFVAQVDSRLPLLQRKWNKVLQR